MNSKRGIRASAFASPAEPSAAVAVAFLREWDPSGPWTLTAIDPDTGKIETRGFHVEQAKQAMAWLDERLLERNLYFSVNRPSRLAHRKLRKDDIAAAIGLHVDVDPLPNADLAEEKKRIREAIAQFSPKPTYLIDSGNGVNAFWKFDTAFAVNSTADRARVESANRSFAARLGADNCHNVDRILRLPGTLNLPTAKKKALGRPASVTSVLTTSPDPDSQRGTAAIHSNGQRAPAPRPRATAQIRGGGPVRTSGVVS